MRASQRDDSSAVVPHGENRLGRPGCADVAGPPGPGSRSATLGQQTAHNNTATDGSIVVMLVQDVPSAARGGLTRVN